MSGKAKSIYGGIDIGGTKLHVVVARDDGKVLGRARKKTRPELGFAAVLDRATRCLDVACQQAGVKPKRLRAIGVGAPSPIDVSGRAVHAPNMGWQNLPLGKKLGKKLHQPVYPENDCNLGTLGEMTFGAGRGAETVVGFFMGTGLGGGIAHRGELIRGHHHLAAELGHLIVAVGGRRCGCGHAGCLEAYASKTGLGHHFKQEIEIGGRESLLTAEAGINLNNVRSGVLARAYRSGDPVTREALHEACHYLGIGVANIATLLGPDRILLGGGVFEALGVELIGQVRSAAQEAVFPSTTAESLDLRMGELGDDAVALGAVAYAQRECQE